MSSSRQPNQKPDDEITARSFFPRSRAHSLLGQHKNNTSDLSVDKEFEKLHEMTQNTNLQQSDLQDQFVTLFTMIPQLLQPLQPGRRGHESKKQELINALNIFITINDPYPTDTEDTLLTQFNNKKVNELVEQKILSDNDQILLINDIKNRAKKSARENTFATISYFKEACEAEVAISKAIAGKTQDSDEQDDIWQAIKNKNVTGYKSILQQTFLDWENQYTKYTEILNLKNAILEAQGTAITILNAKNDAASNNNKDLQNSQLIKEKLSGLLAIIEFLQTLENLAGQLGSQQNKISSYDEKLFPKSDSFQRQQLTKCIEDFYADDKSYGADESAAAKHAIFNKFTYENLKQYYQNLILLIEIISLSDYANSIWEGLLRALELPLCAALTELINKNKTNDLTAKENLIAIMENDLQCEANHYFITANTFAAMDNFFNPNANYKNPNTSYKNPNANYTNFNENYKQYKNLLCALVLMGLIVGTILTCGALGIIAGGTLGAVTIVSSFVGAGTSTLAVTLIGSALVGIGTLISSFFYPLGKVMWHKLNRNSVEAPSQHTEVIAPRIVPTNKTNSYNNSTITIMTTAGIRVLARASSAVVLNYSHTVSAPSSNTHQPIMKENVLINSSPNKSK